MKVHVVELSLPPAVLSLVDADAAALATCSNFWAPRVRPRLSWAGAAVMEAERGLH
jgi:hypothetical protein